MKNEWQKNENQRRFNVICVDFNEYTVYIPRLIVCHTSTILLAFLHPMAVLIGLFAYFLCVYVAYSLSTYQNGLLSRFDKQNHNVLFDAFAISISSRLPITHK